MKKIKLLILLGCLVLLLAAYGESWAAAVGKTAPAFDTIDMQGNARSLSDLRGKVVFVNFWATWCSSCREEMPSIQRLYEKMPKDKFEMIGLFNSDKPEFVKKFISDLGLTFPIWSDKSNIIGARYGLSVLPATLIVDKQGVIRKKFIGPNEWDTPEIIEMLTKYINE